MTVGVPPEMQPWVRQTDRRIGDIQRDQIQIDARITQLQQVPRPVAATSTSAITAPATVGDWALYGSSTSQPPTVRVFTATGRIKVTLSACIEGLWGGTTDEDSYGAMIVTVDGYPLGPLVEEVQRGLVSGFSYYPGMPTGLTESKSSVRTLMLGVGSYTLRTAYIYKNFTGGIQLRWSNRTIVAEPI